ncbi:hypothetical protein THRCLA_01403 [Thraustotheca clavata]|uniref:Uncharacterized protein n=1 Tax=Thraustotheca clavata TaxID=74557 RepID=A0A1W0A8K9_9STRA|nr:hypothetical protein THRCLA_01403 [Thraustotheca clavata]
METILPDPRESMAPVKLPTSLARHIPELKTLCGRYCRHYRSTEEFYLFIRDTFQQHSFQILETILPLIHHDIERHAMLFLRWRRDKPFNKTPCCNVDVCFSCHTAGHYIGQPCESLELNEEMVQCPELQLLFVKKAFVRRLGTTEAFFDAHARSAVLDPEQMLDQWIVGNGVVMGMRIQQLVPLNPEVFIDEPLRNFPVATEVTNYPARYTQHRIDEAANLFPALLPSAFYQNTSCVYFIFDDTNALRLIPLRFDPVYMVTWSEPDYAPLMKYFSTIFGGNDMDESQLIDL